MVFKNRICSCLLLALAIFLSLSCDKKLDFALSIANENKAELEKVIEHFEKDSNPLKLSAAKFLIENMPFHYSKSFEGKTLYDSAYSRMAMEPRQYRDSVFCELIKGIDFQNKESLYDIKTLSAKQIINIVEQACDVWNKSAWKNDYDINYFYNYVLPYRLFNETYSNWRDTIKKEYPYLESNTVWSKNGIHIEAEKALLENATINNFGLASYYKAVTLSDSLSSIKFNINSHVEANRNLIIRYSSSLIDNYVYYSINGAKFQKLLLDPTKSLNVFRNNRSVHEISLRKGVNEITLKYGKGEAAIDYLCLSTVEQYNDNKIKLSGSKYCHLINKKTNKCITYNSHKGVSSHDIVLKPAEEVCDNSNCLHINYQGYACHKISFSTNDQSVLSLESDNKFIKPNISIKAASNRNTTSQSWVFIPIEDNIYKIMNKETGLYLKSETDETGNDYLVEDTYTGSESQKWQIDYTNIKSKFNADYKYGSAISKAVRITDIMNLFEWFSFNGEMMPDAASLFISKTGNCREEAAFIVFLCRYMGIPATVDFTPHWGNRNHGHLWSVLINPDGTHTPFYMGLMPGDTIIEHHNNAKPKVFRHQFQLNQRLYKDFEKEDEIPSLFQNPCLKDVTDEYMSTTNVIRNIPQEYSKKGIAYICVTENGKWIPVHYGKVKGNKVEFKSMGRNIVYITAFYEDGKVKPFGEAFIIENDGKIRDLNANNDKRHDMYLLRKHPFLKKNDKINMRMSDGKFQGSNTPDFSAANDLHTHQGETTGNWYDIKINDTNHYSYLRYIGPKGSYCNINEFVFYDKGGNVIEGKAIGTEGEIGMTIEKAFDKNILTTFQGKSRNGHWVGIKTDTPVQIGKIRYIGRTDGNCIEIGDEYELFYWDNEHWNSLGKKTAQNDTLRYESCPSEGLYILHNHTKGIEERIFTYDGKQIWH